MKQRPSVAAALAASLLFSATAQSVAGDTSWVEQAHIDEAGPVAEEWVLGRAEPPVLDQPSLLAGLRDHFHFAQLVSTVGLLRRSLERSMAVGIDPGTTQPLIAVAPSVAPPVVQGPVSGETLALGRVEADRLLGAGDEEARQQAYLPFDRQRGVSGVVVGRSLAASAAAAGVPAPAMLEALQALATTIDLETDIRDGDRFHVRFEQKFTAEGAPLDVGRVLWIEVRTARTTVALHRFRTRDKAERFWLTNGQAATPPSLRLPLETVSISSGFGLRADPFDQPPSMHAGKPQPMGGPRRDKPALPPGLPTGGALDMPRTTIATPLGASSGLSAYGMPKSAVAVVHPPVRSPRTLFMHEGVDLVAPSGTPILAAADGIVVGAAPNGRYGNWIRIDHAGGLATVYGHLSGFAPAIQPGAVVSRGDVIGFVGSTGRSTGAHVHFELLSDGKPVNPITHPELKRAQLRGADLERFRKQVAASLAERDREAKAVVVSVGD